MTSNELYTLFHQRQSDRKFDTLRPVDPETVYRIVAAAGLAPSACNSQPWEIVAVTDPAEAKRVGKAALKGIVGMNKFVATAPVHLIIVEKKTNFFSYVGSHLRKVDFAHYDVGIFMAHLCLAAAAEGLGSCIIGMLNGKAVAQELGIPLDRRVMFDIILGYSTDKQREKKRKPSEQILHKEKW